MQRQSKLEKVRKIVEIECNEFDEWLWKRHVLYVVKYSKLLAEKLGADSETAEIAELAALLHDIGIAKYGNKCHEKTGQTEAERILNAAGYSQNVIGEVKHCIASHRGSKDIKPKTIAAKIVSNADAMAHFSTIPHIMAVALRNENNDSEKARQWIYDKIERDWGKKLTIPEAKELMREKYIAIKLLFAGEAV